jgi:ATP-dependent RNA helicase RhlE
MQNSTPRLKRKSTRAFSSNSARPQPGKAKKKSNKTQDIPHHKFIQAAKPMVLSTEPKINTRPYTALQLHPKLQANILSKGYTHTTPIQDQAIEPIMEGRDMLGIAQTGTGKTAAFLIPMIQQWLTDDTFKPALVLVPTRELAQQVELEFRTLSEGMNMFSNSYIGGGSVTADIRKLSRYHNLVVGTPGRLLDLVSRRALDLNNFGTLVLDEFDRMLDMGFINDVKKLTATMKARKHTLLFSATIEPGIQEHIDVLLSNPVMVKVNSGVQSADHIEQDIVKVGYGMDKFTLLQNLLSDEALNKVLIFAETKHRVDKVTKKLVDSGFKADMIHGNKSQGQRERALASFRQGRTRILVATDVAARGLDISDVTHVINFEVPKTYDSYIHRIGRTGRAGKAGKAYTFVEG